MSIQTVFLFPGQGSQYVGMGKDLIAQFPEAANVFDEASDALNFNMQSLCFEDAENKLNLTEYTQPAILTMSTAVHRVLKAHSGLQPHVVAGHSLGEYSALVALGALSFSEAVKAVHFRGQAMQKAVPVSVGAMAAYIGQACADVSALCHEVSTPDARVEVANDNCPSQLVLSGHREAVEKVCQLIAEKKLGRAKMLAVSAPFHSSLMQPATEDMKQFFKTVQLNAFEGKLVANVDAKIHTKNNYTVDFLVKQIASPVLWTQTMHTIHELQSTLSSSAHEAKISNEKLWVEVGPGKVLQGLAKKTYETQKCLTTTDINFLNEVLSYSQK